MHSGAEEGAQKFARQSRNFVRFSVVIFLLHAVFMLYRFGELPAAPVIGDEVIINEPALALSRGQGLIAPSFKDSAFGLDRLYSHFPPLYIGAESLALRAFKVSARSLRLTTTVFDFASTAILLYLLWCLGRWRLADWGAAAVGALLYTLNASVIVLHRIGRMESMVEFFVLTGFLLVIRGIYAVPAQDAGPTGEGRSGRHRRVRLLSLAAGSVLTGMAMATHPEALTAVLPTVLLIVLAARVTWARKALLLGLMVSTPIVIWVATYGSKSRQALVNMAHILLYNTPSPGVFSFAHDFFLESHRNSGQAMRATLFFMCLLVAEVVLIRWTLLESSALGHRNELNAAASGRLLITEIFALSSVLSLILLTWFLSASITRYEALFPVYLVGMVMCLRGLPAGRRFVLGTAAVVGTATLLQMLALMLYLHRGSVESVGPHRFDAIVDRVPPGMRIAVTPMMWLAFEQKDRPVTLLYKDFDGLARWRAEAANPLSQFDAIVVDTSFQTEYQTYSRYAAEGRTKQVFQVGGDEVDLYLPAASARK